MIFISAIHTAAVEMLAGQESFNYSRKADIIADAAYIILTKEPKPTGNFFIDEQVVKSAGINDLDQYLCNPEYKDKLMPDLYVDDGPLPSSAPGTPSLTPASGGAKPAQSGAPKGKVAGLFHSIEKNLSEDLVAKTQAVFQFNVSGDEAGKWYIDLKNGRGACGMGESPVKADATLSMDGKNFFDMFSGKLKPATAYMMGKLKISGNLQKALKLEKLMVSLKSKL